MLHCCILVQFYAFLLGIMLGAVVYCQNRVIRDKYYTKYESIILQHHYLNGFLRGIICLIVQYCLSALPLSLCLLSLSFLLGNTPVSGYVIGLCRIIFDNEGGYCLFDWLVTERESSQFNRLVSARLAAASLQRSLCSPSAPGHVFLVQFYSSV